MSTHPNAILFLSLTPNGLSRKTMRDILEENQVKDGDQIKIGGVDYHPVIMESDYDEGFQLASKEGDLVFLDMITYGYGDVIAWSKLEEQKKSLDELSLIHI